MHRALSPKRPRTEIRQHGYNGLNAWDIGAPNSPVSCGNHNPHWPMTARAFEQKSTAQNS